MSDLSSCRCGGKPEWTELRNFLSIPKRYRLMCPKCGACTAAYEHEKQANAEWNDDRNRHHEKQS